MYNDTATDNAAILKAILKFWRDKEATTVRGQVVRTGGLEYKSSYGVRTNMRNGVPPDSVEASINYKSRDVIVD